MRTLETLSIRNFKSIRDQTLRLDPLNVFIGGNGSGKSNLLQVFRLLHEIANQNLAGYTAVAGGADSLLHFGRKASPTMSLRLELAEDERWREYDVALRGTASDDLIVGGEMVSSHQRDRYPHPFSHSTASEERESGLRDDRDPDAQAIAAVLESCRVYHLNDSTEHARVKTNDIDDNRFLRERGENLAALLYWLQETRPEHMAAIRDTIRQIAPFFDRFRLEPRRLNPSEIRLEWLERGTDTYFNASSLSDGTWRFICLAALHLQPTLPPLILLDEPELGLHPAAITLLAELLDSASTRTQILVATQSVTLVNQLEPRQVWTVERAGSESIFRHLSGADTAGWLEEFALGELWEKNVIGARP